MRIINISNKKILSIWMLAICIAMAQDSIAPVQHKTVVEANHYFSDTQKKAIYTVANVQGSKSLIFVLRDKQTSQSSLKVDKNPLNITLTSGSKKSQCFFDSYSGLCVVDNVLDTETSMQMVVECKSLPCDISWTIFQPKPKIPTMSQPLQQLYQLSDSSKHMIAMVSCNDPAIKDFSSDIVVYSDNPFTKSVTENVVYYLFNNEKKGYMFAQVGQKTRHCAMLGMYNVSQDVKTSQKRQNRDFIRNDSISIFKIDQNPATDFQIDCSMHELDKTKNVKSPLDIKLTGLKNGQRQTVTEYLVKPFLKKPTFQFKFLIKKVAAQYSDLQFQFKSNGNVIMLNFRLIVDNRISVKVGDLTYFNLKKGENLLYKFEGNSEQDDSALAFIYPSNKNSLNVSLQSCSSKAGCQFQVKCANDIKGSLYLGKGKKQDQEQIVYSELKNTATKRGREGDQDYYKIPMKANKAIQLVVNSPNVIVYASTQQKCPRPSRDCYQKVLNMHHPFIYQPQKDGQLMLVVQVLDTCQYTLTVIQEGTDLIQLKDGISFGYLLDDHEDKLLFKFKLQKKQLINFNLIAPLNSLYLLVENGVKKPSEKQLNIASTDGFISFDKSDVDSLEFRILVKKTQAYSGKFVHFNLIASTKDSNLRLQAGIAHYETLQPSAHRDFAFQFEPKNDYIVTFSSYNLKGKKIQIQMLVSNQDEWKVNKNIQKFVIDRQTDTLQLKDVSQTLCQKQGEQTCEIFIRLINPMNIQIDLTINLLVKNSIVELKDGIWQSYGENTIANSAKFYFYPKHRNKSVSISYKSLSTDLRILYSIWKADDKNINPAQWPFPKVAKQTQKSITLFKPVKHVSIDHDSLKGCWPSCVVLVSLLKNSTQVKGQYESAMQYGGFSIMASNSFIQIPQKDKIDIVLKASQEKYFMIDLKYLLEKEDAALTLFTYTTIGFFEITGNLYSEKNPRCPQGNGDSDFRFGNLQTQIKLGAIKDKMKQLQMQDDRNVYICLLTKAYSDTKMSIQYTADQGIIKLLDLDSIQKVSVKKGQSKVFQLSANQQYYVKVTRNSGFPFVSFAKCTEGDDYQKCLQKFLQQKQKGKQLLAKTQSFTQQPCMKCIIFIKVQAQQPAQLDLHLQSKYTQIQLKQSQMLSDFTNLGQQNRYLVTALRNQQTIINIQVMEGDLQIQITDFNKINIKKSNDKNTKIIHIVIPVQDHQQESNAIADLANLGQGWMTAFGLSQTFSYLHLTVRAKDGKGATSYTVLYSSGERQIYLQDGLMSDYNLEPEKQTTFYYQNKGGQGHIYLFVSMENSASLFNVEMKMYYLVDPQDEDTAVQITPQKPPMRKKTPSPTMLFSLPAQKFFIIKAKNPSNKQETLTVGINHQEVIYLPFNHDFPFALHKSETINLLVDVNNPGYLKISIRKCDQSNPKFGYTFDYQSFQKGEFTYQSILNEDPRFQYYIKSKTVGTLYMNFQTDAEDESLLSVKVQYSPQKLKSSGVKPGNKGLLEYQLLDSNTAQLMFTGVLCAKSANCEEYEYYTISSLKQQDLYTQIVCPSTYFSMFEATSVKPLPLTKIKETADSNGKIVFKYSLMDHISYVGIKGISKKSGEQIYYRPVQIVTMWGQISRTSTSHKLTIFGVSICMILALLIWVRRNARKGYRPLTQDD